MTVTQFYLKIIEPVIEVLSGDIGTQLHYGQVKILTSPSHLSISFKRVHVQTLDQTNSAYCVAISHEKTVLMACM